MRHEKRNLTMAASLAVILLAAVLVMADHFAAGTHLYQFPAAEPIVIGDYVDTFRYGGDGVRLLEGEAFLDFDPWSDEGLLIAEVTTTAESGPILIADGVALEGTIRLVMEEFLGPEAFMQGGIAEPLSAHGDTGIMSSVLPELRLDYAGWGLLDLYVNGELLYDGLAGHFMLGDRVRRGPEGSFAIFRDSDELIYSPDLLDKTGFQYSTEKELHIFAADSLAGIESHLPGPLALHINLILGSTPRTLSAASPPSTSTPEEPTGGGGGETGGNGKQKGNNGIGNGEDPQPPGNPKQND